LREYETTFIVQPEISDEGCQELLARVDGILEREGAVRLLHDDQGKRKLAYEIRRFQKGRYVTTFYLDHGKAVAPLERTLRLEESVLRFLTVQVTDRVEDVEQRKLAAAEEERIRAERAKERAAREAEEEKARQEAAKLARETFARESAEAEALAAEQAAEAEKLGAEESESEDSEAEPLAEQVGEVDEPGEEESKSEDSEAEPLAEQVGEVDEPGEAESKLENSETENGGER
jgi:small subunit ribosomal protein S6